MIKLVCNPMAHCSIQFDEPATVISFQGDNERSIVVKNGVPQTISGDYEDYDLSRLVKAGVKLDKIDLSAFSNLSVSEQNEAIESLASKINEFQKKLMSNSNSND